MKILCSLSSVEFSVDHFPGTFYSREFYHPIFDLPQRKLLGYTGKWAAGHLTPTDSYLLFLSLLHSSNLVEWRVPVARTEQTEALVANNMEALIRSVIRLNTVTNPDQVFPHYAISNDTRFLSNVQYWIENWDHCYKEFKAGYRSAHESSALIRRENALSRLIRNPYKSVASYAAELAHWASQAGTFPTFLTTSPFSKEPAQIPCADLWKEIIIRCARNEYIFGIPDRDLQELMLHCEDNIPMGSIQSHLLHRVLKDAIGRKRIFLDLGDPDIKTSYTILENSQSVEDANMKALIDSAPAELPVREHYPSEFQYRRAKLRWEMAQKFGRANPKEPPEEQE